MKAIRVRTLENLEEVDLARLVGGYVSREKYAVEKSESRRRTRVTLRRTRTRTPFVKEFSRSVDDLEGYRDVLRLGWSLGAYEGRSLVALAIAEPREWNRSVWVLEIGVASTHRRRGIGRRLVEELSRRAHDAGFRVLVCETQTTNVPAIDFYRNLGFTLEGVDLSYYTNKDVSKGEIAVFMKRAVPAKGRHAPRRLHSESTSK